MTLRTQVLVWVGFTAVVILLIWLFRPILLPFVLGIALAYILNPLVNAAIRLGLKRGWASAIVLLAGVGVIVALLILVIPVIASQVAGLAARLPEYAGNLQNLVQSLTPQLSDWLGPVQVAELQKSFSQFIGTGVEFIGNLTGQIAASGLTVLNTIAVLFLTPVVAFYLLIDWDRMVKSVDELLPREHRREIRQVLDQINTAIAGVIRGQGGVVLALCIYYTTALSLTGLNFGLAIGLLTGLLSFVPFLGFLSGLVVAMAIALVQFAPNWWFVAIVFSVYAIGTFLEGNVLYPRLVGQSININPVWLMFSLFAFAFLFGLVGLVLAVPLSAIAATLIRYAVRRYKQSILYGGERSSGRHAAPGPAPDMAVPATAAAAAASPKARARSTRAK
ncbi:MAG: AI-2E family transporter [Devosia sp.]